MNASSFIPYYGAYVDWSNVINLYDSGEISFSEAVKESILIGAIQGISFGVTMSLIPTLGLVHFARNVAAISPVAGLTAATYIAGELLFEHGVDQVTFDVTPGGETVHSVTPTMAPGIVGYLERLFD